MSKNKYKVIPLQQIIKGEGSKLHHYTNVRVDARVLQEIINKIHEQYKVEGYKFHSITGAGLLYVIFEKIEPENDNAQPAPNGGLCPKVYEELSKIKKTVMYEKRKVTIDHEEYLELKRKSKDEEKSRMIIAACEHFIGTAKGAMVAPSMCVSYRKILDAVEVLEKDVQKFKIEEAKSEILDINAMMEQLTQSKTTWDKFNYSLETFLEKVRGVNLKNQ